MTYKVYARCGLSCEVCREHTDRSHRSQLTGPQISVTVTPTRARRTQVSLLIYHRGRARGRGTPRTPGKRNVLHARAQTFLVAAISAPHLTVQARRCKAVHAMAREVHMLLLLSRVRSLLLLCFTTTAGRSRSLAALGGARAARLLSKRVKLAGRRHWSGPLAHKE